MHTFQSPHKFIYRLGGLLIAALVAVVLINTHSYAADGSWNVDAGGNWSGSGNWLGGTIADGANSTATFGNVIGGNRTVTLDTNRTIGNISATDTSHDYTITGTTILTLDNGGSTPDINVGTSNRNLFIDGTSGLTLTGGNGFSKSGPGTLYLEGVNSTFTGNVTLNGGTLREVGPAGLGNSTQLIFAGDATFIPDRPTEPTYSQAVTVNPGVTATFNSINQFWDHGFTGAVTGSGNLIATSTDNGAGVLTLSNTGNTLSGFIQVGSSLRGGTLNMSSLADTASKINLGGLSNNRPANLNLNIASPYSISNRQIELISTQANSGAVLRNNNGTASNTLQVDLDLAITGSGNKNFGLGGSNAGNNTFAGDIPDALGASVLNLLKRDGGKWVLTGVNTYEGYTDIENGTLEVGGTGQLGGGNYAGTITIGSGDSLIWNSSASQTLSGSIIDDSNNGTLTKDNTGILTLSGANSYDGTTTIDGGTLLINNTTGTGAVNVNSGGTLGGIGTIGGAVTVASGGVASPGASRGALSASTFTLQNGSTYYYESGFGGNQDLVNVSGLLTLDAGWILQLAPYLRKDPLSTFDLFQYGSLNGGSFTAPVIDFSLTNFADASGISFNDTGSSIQVIGLAIPEPSSMVLFAGLLAGLAAVARRRRG